MDIKLVVLDMDGTLLDSEHEITTKNKEVITKLMKQGVQFILASGRSYDSMAPYIKELGLDLPVISSNGAFVKSPKDHKIYCNLNVCLDLTQEIVDYGLEHEYGVSLYFEDGVSTLNEEMIDAHKEIEGLDVDLIKPNQIDKSPNKIIYFDNYERIGEAFKITEKRYGEKVYVTRSGDFYLDFMSLQTSKGYAVKIVMDAMDISKNEIMVIGDNFNDIPMFEHAGIAVAMGNALPEVKEQSDYVTKTNVEDGVAYALEKFIK